MDLILKVITQAGKEQEQLEAALDAAGILRIPSATPPFFLLGASDFEALSAIASRFRCKPVVVDIDADDVPEPDGAPGRGYPLGAGGLTPRTATAAVVTMIHRAGYTFNWDKDTSLWCVSGLHDGFIDETADAPAPGRRAAAFAALRHIVA